MARQEVAHTGEALDAVIPDALSSVKLEDVSGMVLTLRLRTTGSIRMKTALVNPRLNANRPRDVFSFP
jgi:hypothetical protein